MINQLIFKLQRLNLCEKTLKQHQHNVKNARKQHYLVEIEMFGLKHLSKNVQFHLQSNLSLYLIQFIMLIPK